jgi:segregation and condensation protein A
MEALTYHLEKFDGPLDLLLSLIQKNKVEITDIPISLICDQYMEYLHAAEEMDLDLASEFIVMASELMLIKSKLLLPRVEEEEEDPRAALADALLKYQQAKQGAALLAPAYTKYSGRMVKDTDEISVDKTFVADQSVTDLCAAVRRIIAYREEKPRAEKVTFTPMISSPIVPVEAKIVGILRHFETEEQMSLSSLLDDSVSLSDLIAIFLGVLELIKVRRLRILEDPDSSETVLGADTVFVQGEGNESDISFDDFDQPAETALYDITEQEESVHE